MLTLLRQEELLEHYLSYVFDRLSKQGYQRVELRAQPLYLYDS